MWIQGRGLGETQEVYLGWNFIPKIPVDQPDHRMIQQYKQKHGQQCCREPEALQSFNALELAAIAVTVTLSDPLAVLGLAARPGPSA